MSKNSNDGSKVRPVAKEMRPFVLLERTSSCFSVGVEITFEEFFDYLTQTFNWEAKRFEEIRKKGKAVEKIVLWMEAQRRYNGAGEWYLDGFLGGCAAGIKGYLKNGGIKLGYANEFGLQVEDVFRNFGVELGYVLPELKIVATKFFTTGDKVMFPEVGDAQYVVAEVVEADLSDNGKQIIDAARRQSKRLNELLAPTEGIIKVNIWEAGDVHSKDIFSVKTVSKSKVKKQVSYDLDDWQKTETIPDNKRTFFVPRKYAEGYLEGTWTGAEVINELGFVVMYYCGDAKFKLA